MDPVIEAVTGCTDLRALRKGLHALRKTEDPRALSVIAEYIGHPDTTIDHLARNLLTPRATKNGTAPQQKDFHPRRQTKVRNTGHI